MSTTSYCLSQEMPELKDAVHKLKTTDHHFAKVLGKYEELNKEIGQIETNVHPASDEHLENLKKQRLNYKDELIAIIGKAA